MRIDGDKKDEGQLGMVGRKPQTCKVTSEERQKEEKARQEVLGVESVERAPAYGSVQQSKNGGSKC